MKLHSLLLPLIVIGSAIAPILSMSLPAQSEPVLSPPIISQIDETVDFGTLTINGIWKERQIEVKKVARSKVVIYPEANKPNCQS
jgi:hypothetical protein